MKWKKGIFTTSIQILVKASERPIFRDKGRGARGVRGSAAVDKSMVTELTRVQVPPPAPDLIRLSKP